MPHKYLLAGALCKIFISNQKIHFSLKNLLFTLFLFLALPAYAQETWDKMLNTGIALFEAGKNTEGIQELERALAQAEREFGKKPPQYTKNLLTLAIVQQQIGGGSKVARYLQEALDIFKQAGINSSPEYLQTLNQLAVYHTGLGFFQKAENMHLEIAEVLLNNGKHDTEFFAENLVGYAMVLINLGNFQSALEIASIARELYTKLFPNTSYQVISSWLVMGTIYQAKYDYVESELCVKVAKLYSGDAYTAWKAGKIKDFSYVIHATILGIQAELLTTTGRQVQAEAVYKEALNLLAGTVGDKSSGYLMTKAGLGWCCVKLKRFEEAEKTLLEVLQGLAITEGRQGKNYGLVQNKLGVLYSETKKFDKAKQLYEEALQNHGTQGIETSAYINTLGNLGMAYADLGIKKQALDMLKQKLGLVEKVFSKQSNDYVLSLDQMASVLQKMGKYKESLELLKEGITLKIKQQQDNLPAFSETEKLQYVQENAWYFNKYEGGCLDYYTYYKKDISHLSNLYNVRINRKGVLLSSAIKLKKAVQEHPDKTLKEIYGEWLSLKQKKAKFQNYSLAQRTEQGIDLEQLNRQIMNKEKAIGYYLPLEYATVDWKTIQAKLKPQEVAIEIVRASLIDSTQKEKVLYGALILTSQTKDSPEIVVLENGAEMEGKFLNNYRNSIKAKKEDKYSYKIYWQPIAEKLKSLGTFTKIYWASDGVFQQISLNTLMNTDNKRYVLDDFTIQQLSSTKDILELGKRTTDKNAPKSARLFARPDYDIEQADFQKHIEASPKNQERETRFSENLANTDFADLAGTEREVQSIESTLKSQKFNTIETFYQTKATEEEVKKTKSPTVLHIATHGFWFEPQDSTHNQQPMLYSGIVLAGVKNYFSAQTKPDTDDGILTAYEAMSMDLENTELVVLSACETGLGKLQAGEGVFGLQRAFQVAGAKAVITSLWTVSDEATSVLMSEFYKILPTAPTKLEAFRMAQKKVKEQFPEPYFWGAFVMVGE